MHITTLAVPSFLLFACASGPVPSTEPVRALTADQKKSVQCTSLGTFTITQRGGPDKATAALLQARSEVSRRGGNAMYVISRSDDWEFGAAMQAEAFQCQP